MDFSMLLDYKNKSEEELEKYVNNESFKLACENGHLEVAQWLLSIKPDINISADDDCAFRWTCDYGHLEVAQWLRSIKPDINISAEDDWAFKGACENGHLEVAQWLLSIKPDINISAEYDFSFIFACQGGHLDVSRWLCTLDNRYQIEIKNNKIIDWDVFKIIKPVKTIKIENKEECCVCYELSDIQTNCGHYVCQRCFNKLNDKCPYCRSQISEYYKIE